ncbi:MAG: circadian clock KaiB family protein [Legionellaceae bacterium]|nr:circadian clock KaiB family protein [Legionellaceae bacterium]
MNQYKLKLYILGYTALARKAIQNLEKICETKTLNHQYKIEVINLLDKPQLAEKERIIATPTLIKELPEPIRRVIGDLSDYEQVLVGLDINEIDHFKK